VRVVEAAGLEVLEWGAESSRPLVFLHGFGPFNAGAASVATAAPLWAEEGFRVLAPNAPGFGGSRPLEPEEYRVARIAELIVHVIDELEVDRAAVVGFSWGGRIALRLPPDRVSALVLLDIGYKPPPDFPPYEELLARYREQWPSWESWPTFLEEARKFTKDTPGTEERLRAAMVERDGRVVPRLSPEITAGAFSWIPREPDGEWWERWRETPLLLLVATEPSVDEESVATFASALPDAEIERVPEAGHDVVSDRPDVVVPLVACFLHSRAVSPASAERRSRRR
jgi:2-succinyl-6-hydroxy-2,4-cyclohexadiene-1-carboxylate synthase